MKIKRAEHLGMCFGVRDAINLALKESRSEPLTILGQLVHNETVLSSLRERGIQFQDQAEKVETRRAMITAHGASEHMIQRVQSHGLEVIQATCPLVHHAHRAVKQLVEQGFHPVIIGQPGHVEVRGIIEDLKEYDVITSASDVDLLAERPRFGIAAQTTQPIQRVRNLVQRVRQRFSNSEVRFIDTVCQPTKQRQSAAIQLAQESNLVLVIGGANSNNTRELVSTCSQYCRRVFHIRDASDLKPEWFHEVDLVGITAGTSTPDSTIDAVETWLRQLGEHTRNRSLVSACATDY